MKLIQLAQVIHALQKPRWLNLGALGCLRGLGYARINKPFQYSSNQDFPANVTAALYSSLIRYGQAVKNAKPFCLLLLLTSLVLAPVGAWAQEVWVDIDTGSRTLFVKQGDDTISVFENISIGQNGVSSERLVGDQTTPLGSYHVRRINESSRFHLFFGLDYPNEEQAVTAFMADQISARELELIFQAHQKDQEPPASTPLGGLIGIHGLGAGNPEIHENFDWTDGCVALTDSQVDELSRWVKPGTRVLIR